MRDDNSAKTENPKVDSFKTWLESKPYWEQFLWRLHMEKDLLEEADIDQTYQYLLEDSEVIELSSVRITITFPPLDLDSAELPKAKITLDKLENLNEVNALDNECSLEFGKNLTIIYGDNGTGKSGIGRLLSNACLSRKPRQLLPDARATTYSSPKPSADFSTSDSTGSNKINYTLGQVHDALKSFSVFDQECALIHLNNENTIEFVPSKIQIFDSVFKSIVAIETKLQAEINARTKENPTEGIFTGSSKLTEFIDSLSYNTTDEEIDSELIFTENNKKLLEEKKVLLGVKQKQDVSKQKEELTDECKDLDAFIQILTATSSILSKIKADQVNLLIQEINEKKEIVDKLSVNNFEFSAFKNIGDPEWKSLITAAQKLYEKETLSNEGVEPTHCILCRQALTSTEKTLFGEYWKFLNSTAETELITARKNIATFINDLEKDGNTWPVFSETEVAIKILKKNIPTELIALKAAFDALKVQHLVWIECLKKEEKVIFSDPDIKLDSITNLISRKKEEEVKLVDPTSEIKAIEDEVFYLEQKMQASGILVKIKEYVAWLHWSNSVSIINLPAVRGNITRKKTEIMNELVISKYVDIFNNEIERLDSNFGLGVESHGKDANTIKVLKLNFARGYSPSDILSEGEQIVSALADFLTEAKLDKNNSGIIFDDPVNSLDHGRISTIAKRLVEEAKERQVIIFTHDIIFLLELQFYADRESVDNTTLSMRRIGDKVGVIKSELPWIALNVGKKVGYLKNELATLKKAETGDQDEYRNKVKLWYELLREAWERAVEERLFKGVVQRFNKAVMTLKLDKVEVNPALIKEITDGMSESSKWLHDMGSGMNPSIPKNAKLESELKSLEDFIVKCKPS